MSSSPYMALALKTCVHCNGLGVRFVGLAHEETICSCCDREIFRIVLRAYKYYSESIGKIRSILTQFNCAASRQGRRANGHRSEEFVADVWLCAKRNLSPRQWQIFRSHHIAGEPWNKIGIERGTFWHEKYRLEETLGRVFRELFPYALYPVDQYFNDTILTLDPGIRPFMPVTYKNGEPLCPPLAPGVRPTVAKVPVPVLAPAVVIPPEPPPPADETIRRLFRSGVNLQLIARKVSDLGIPPPTGATHWTAGYIKSELLKRAA